MTQNCDYLVIGSGIAGLSYALKVAEKGSVIIVTKCGPEETNTKYAQGGIASVFSEEDDFQLHVRDTLVAGAGLCHEDAVCMIVESGPARIRELIDWGVQFTKSSDEKNGYDLHLEGGHSRKRILHAADLTGAAIEKALLERVREHPNITMLDHHMAIDLIMKRKVDGSPKNDRCLGAYVLNTQTGEIPAYVAKATLLATGGMGKVYLVTSNPDIASGDGVAIAFRAGAAVANMEFMQFHPTTLYHENADSFLISEALRGHGAILCRADGTTFMESYHPQKSLAPRDVVARAMDKEMKLSGEPCVFLDLRHIPPGRTIDHFPHIYNRCKSYGIDITRDLIPVVPAAHYMCGGVLVDTAGASSLSNLYACGEVSCTGVHGANRLASNSLLEALVFSRRAADAAGPRLGDIAAPVPGVVPAWDDHDTTAAEEWILLSHNFHEIRSIMWDYVGIVRSTLRLKRAQRRINLLEKEIDRFYRRTRITAPLLDLRNTVTTARLIISCALKRKESRGLHFTTDYQRQLGSRWARDTVITRPTRP